MIEGLETVDLVSVVQEAGVELRKRGRRHVGTCPFHSDTNPSFYVFEDGHYHCFGCGEHGDAVNFVRKLKGCSFGEALIALGLNGRTYTAGASQETGLQKYRRQLVRDFRAWEASMAGELGLLIRAAHRALSRIKTMDQLEALGEIYHGLVLWEHALFDVLVNGDDEDKFQLYRRSIAHTEAV